MAWWRISWWTALPWSQGSSIKSWRVQVKTPFTTSSMAFMLTPPVACDSEHLIRWSRYFKITDIHACCKSRICSYQFWCYRVARYLLCHYLLPHGAVLLSLDDADTAWSSTLESLTSTRTQAASHMTQQLHMLQEYYYFYSYRRKRHLNLIKLYNILHSNQCERTYN